MYRSRAHSFTDYKIVALLVPLLLLPPDARADHPPARPGGRVLAVGAGFAAALSRGIDPYGRDDARLFGGWLSLRAGGRVSSRVAVLLDVSQSLGQTTWSTQDTIRAALGGIGAAALAVQVSVGERVALRAGAGPVWFLEVGARQAIGGGLPLSIDIAVFRPPAGALSLTAQVTPFVVRVICAPCIRTDWNAGAQFGVGLSWEFAAGRAADLRSTRPVLVGAGAPRCLPRSLGGPIGWGAQVPGGTYSGGTCSETGRIRRNRNHVVHGLQETVSAR